MNSVKHLSNLCYCVLLPCFSLLTHNACPTYSWFSECLSPPSKGCLMWPRRSSKVHNGWKRVQTVPNLVWWSLQKRCRWKLRINFDTSHICSRMSCLIIMIQMSSFKTLQKWFSVTDHEKRRLQDAFRRSSAANNNISKQVHIEAQKVKEACKSLNHF